MGGAFRCGPVMRGNGTGLMTEMGGAEGFGPPARWMCARTGFALSQPGKLQDAGEPVTSGV